jgi:hypothetical protein
MSQSDLRDSAQSAFAPGGADDACEVSWNERSTSSPAGPIVPESPSGASSR